MKHYVYWHELLQKIRFHVDLRLVWKYHVVNTWSNITLKYISVCSLFSAVTLCNKVLGNNELQYEIWADIVHINVDAAQSQREGEREV